MTKTANLYLLLLATILHSRSSLAAQEGSEHSSMTAVMEGFTPCQEADRIIGLGQHITLANKDATFEDSEQIPMAENDGEFPKEIYNRASFFYLCTKLFPGTIEGAMSLLRNEMNISMIRAPSAVPYVRRLIHKLEGYPLVECRTKDQAISCVRPADITNGELQPDQGSYTENMVITYTCAPGYHQTSGHAQRTCQRNGQWAGDQPKCEMGERIVCQRPNGIANGQFTTDNEDYGINTNIEYECISGYEVEGDRQRTCMHDGTWSGFKPRCVRTGSCYGRCFDKWVSGLSCYCDEECWKYGNCCDDLSKLCSRTIHAPQPDATPDKPEQPPKALECPALSGITNGHFFPEEGSYERDTVVAHWCDRPYTLLGDNFRKCQTDGKWSGSQPSCVTGGQAQPQPIQPRPGQPSQPGQTDPTQPNATNPVGTTGDGSI